MLTVCGSACCVAHCCATAPSVAHSHIGYVHRGNQTAGGRSAKPQSSNTTRCTCNISTKGRATCHVVLSPTHSHTTTTTTTAPSCLLLLSLRPSLPTSFLPKTTHTHTHTSIVQLIKSCNTPEQQALAFITLANRMLSQCEVQVARIGTFAFPLAYVCVAVGAAVPEFMELLLAKLQQVR